MKSLNRDCDDSKYFELYTEERKKNPRKEVKLLESRTSPSKKAKVGNLFALYFCFAFFFFSEGGTSSCAQGLVLTLVVLKGQMGACDQISYLQGKYPTTILSC